MIVLKDFVCEHCNHTLEEYVTLKSIRDTPEPERCPECPECGNRTNPVVGITVNPNGHGRHVSWSLHHAAD
jgi:NAD-dependent SIR2 family protein deacetylase